MDYSDLGEGQQIHTSCVLSVWKQREVRVNFVNSTGCRVGHSQ
jgi:hypothetical protein